MWTDKPISKAKTKVARCLRVSRDSLTCWVKEKKLAGFETAGGLEGTVARVVTENWKEVRSPPYMCLYVI